MKSEIPMCIYYISRNRIVTSVLDSLQYLEIDINLNQQLELEIYTQNLLNLHKDFIIKTPSVNSGLNIIRGYTSTTTSEVINMEDIIPYSDFELDGLIKYLTRCICRRLMSFGIDTSEDSFYPTLLKFIKENGTQPQLSERS